MNYEPWNGRLHHPPLAHNLGNVLSDLGRLERPRLPIPGRLLP